MPEYYLEPDNQEELGFVLEPEVATATKETPRAIYKNKTSLGDTINAFAGEPSAAANRAVIRASMKPNEAGGQTSRLAFFGPLAAYKVAAFGDTPEVEKAALKGFTDPSSIERFQDESIRKATEPFVEEWSQRKGIFSPENKFGKFLIGAESFARGLVPSTVGVLQDMAVNPVDVALSVGDAALQTKQLIPKQPLREQLKKQIDDVVNHTIKPTSAGIRSKSTLKSKISRYESAVGDVIENVDNIVLPSGNPVPKTADDLLEGMSQTKQQIFNEYNKLKQLAGENGVVLDKNKIAQELLERYSRQSLNVTSPETKKYAQELTLALNSVGDLTPDLVQNMIEDLNEGLRGFYRGGASSFKDIGKASVDAQFAKTLRSNLDNAIMKDVGPGYQVLKNKYGAIAEAEEQLAKQVLAIAKKNKASIFDVIDVISAGQIMQGAITGNYALAMRGGIQSIGKSFLKNMNDANRNVDKLFTSSIKKSIQKSPDKILSGVQRVAIPGKRIPKQVEELNGE